MNRRELLGGVLAGLGVALTRKLSKAWAREKRKPRHFVGTNAVIKFDGVRLEPWGDAAARPREMGEAAEQCAGAFAAIPYVKDGDVLTAARVNAIIEAVNAGSGR